jgi:hypothetical protein
MRILTNNFEQEIHRLLSGSQDVWIACPYINTDVFLRLFGAKWWLITDANKWIESAAKDKKRAEEVLVFLSKYKDRIRHAERLHAKVVFCKNGIYVASTNITQSGLFHNDEIGAIDTNFSRVKEAYCWFELLWNTGTKITDEYINRVRREIAEWPEEKRDKKQPLPSFDAQRPLIIEQPKSITVRIGERARLSVVAKVNDGGILSYQWHRGNEAIYGATDSVYLPPTETEVVAWIYCNITNKNIYSIGRKKTTTKSDEVLLCVYPPIINKPTIVNAKPPAITAQPHGAVVNINERAGTKNIPEEVRANVPSPPEIIPPPANPPKKQNENLPVGCYIALAILAIIIIILIATGNGMIVIAGAFWMGMIFYILYKGKH